MCFHLSHRAGHFQRWAIRIISPTCVLVLLYIHSIAAWRAGSFLQQVKSPSANTQGLTRAELQANILAYACKHAHMLIRCIFLCQADPPLDIGSL